MQGSNRNWQGECSIWQLQTLISNVLTHTFLSSYAWTIAECRICSHHMGWKFTACKKELTPSRFWGLTRASLTPKISEWLVQWTAAFVKAYSDNAWLFESFMGLFRSHFDAINATVYFPAFWNFRVQFLDSCPVNICRGTDVAMLDIDYLAVPDVYTRSELNCSLRR